MSHDQNATAEYCVPDYGGEPDYGAGVLRVSGVLHHSVQLCLPGAGGGEEGGGG